MAEYGKGMVKGRTTLVFVLMMLLVPWSNYGLEESSKTSEVWQREDLPNGPGAMALGVWQPSLPAVFWDVEWSPSETHLAAVGLDGGLSIWNVSDDRVVLRLTHSMQLLGLAWLDNEHVVTLEQRHRWNVYRVVDDGAGRPKDTIEDNTGYWSSNLSGVEQNWGHDMEVSPDGSRIAFCGGRPANGGELVVLDTSYLLGVGDANNIAMHTPDVVKACRWSPDGNSIATLERSSGGDSVRIFNQSTLEQTHQHNIAPTSSAWHLDWKGDSEYSVAWTKSSGESVVSHFLSGGEVLWYQPLEQNISRLEWSLHSDTLYVGLLGEGQVLVLDAAGEEVSSNGWHAYRSTKSDIRALAATLDGRRLASAGQDGTVEVWNIQPTGHLELSAIHDSSIMRELEFDPSGNKVAIAQGSGTLDVHDLKSGARMHTCQHPDWGRDVDEVPYVKSVKWQDEQVVVAGFTDGMVIWCSLEGSTRSFNLGEVMDIDVFGRLAFKDSRVMAVSSVPDGNDTTVDGEVTILVSVGTEWEPQMSWTCADTCWVMEFNYDGSRLVSASQSGQIRLWNTEADSTDEWYELPSPYSHVNYTGVVEWAPNSNMLLSVGWDGKAILYDVDNEVERWQSSVPYEGFSAGFSADEQHIIIGSGVASDSSVGEVRVLDLISGQIYDTWSTVGIPRGVGLQQTSMGMRYVVANSTGGWMTWLPDTDEDGHPDSTDLWPQDPSQWADSDGDGYGDNSEGQSGDDCPYLTGSSTEDRLGCPDSDADGWSDADSEWFSHPVGSADAFPLDSEQWNDSDSDGYGDNYLWEGSPHQHLNQRGDAFPNDPQQWNDSDGDGCGDNYSFTNSSNGLKQFEFGDAFISDHTQCADKDGDGYGDNYTWTLDFDGLRIENGDAFPSNPLAWSDLDGDGCAPDSIRADEIDMYPEDATRCQGDPVPSMPENVDVFVTSDMQRWNLRYSWHQRGENSDMIEIFAVELNASEECDQRCWQNPLVTYNPAPTSYTDEVVYIDRTGPLRLQVIIRSINSEHNTMVDMWWNETAEPLPSDPISEENNTVVDGEQNTDNEGGQNETSNTSSLSTNSSSSMLIWGGAAGLLALIVVLVLRRRKPTDTSDPWSATPSSNVLPLAGQPVCTRCGGTTQEVEHEGQMWKWCSSCQQYDY